MITKNSQQIRIWEIEKQQRDYKHVQEVRDLKQKQYDEQISTLVSIGCLKSQVNYYQALLTGLSGKRILKNI